MATALEAAKIAVSLTLTDGSDVALSNAQTFSYTLPDDDGLLSEHDIRELAAKIKAAYIAADADPVA